MCVQEILKIEIKSNKTSWAWRVHLLSQHVEWRPGDWALKTILGYKEFKAQSQDKQQQSKTQSPLPRTVTTDTIQGQLSSTDPQT